MPKSKRKPNKRKMVIKHNKGIILNQAGLIYALEQVVGGFPVF
jgi:hypothetical protein